VGGERPGGGILSVVLPYRTDEDAARVLAAELERETADLWRENVALATKLARTEAARDAALERLAEAGPGGGRPSARRDRIGLGALVLALAAVALLPAPAFLFPSISNRIPFAPVLVLLAAPGVIAVLVGHRYRRVSVACRIAVQLGVGAILWTLFELVGGGL
jgi:hypothetical protein